MTACTGADPPLEGLVAPRGARAAFTSVLVVVPAHNEEAHIGACLASVAKAVVRLRRRHPAVVVTITVVLDACTDRTAEVASAVADVDLVRVDVRSVGAARRAGVSAAVAALGRHDASRVLLVNTDADSVVPPCWLVEHVGLAAGHDLVLGEVQPDPVDLTPSVLARWWTRHPRGVGGLHGANLSVRLDAYLRVGGFAAVPLQEDVLLVRALRQSGAAVTGGTRVTTSGRLTGRATGGFASYLRALSTEDADRSGAAVGE